MAQVTLDLQDRHGGRLTEDGWEFDRIAIVTGIEGDGHSKIYNAVNIEGMPSIGEEHPAVSGCLLRSIDPIKITPTIIKFSLKYRTKSGSGSGGFVDNSIQVGGSIIQETTNTDKDGNEMNLQYTYPSDYKAAYLQNETDNPGHEASILQPQFILIFQKLRSYCPDSEAMTYISKVNSNIWRGGAARTWLCSGIMGYSDDGGSSYKVTYQFQYKPQTWDDNALYRKADDGKPPYPTDLNSKKTYRVQGEANLGQLSL